MYSSLNLKGGGGVLNQMYNDVQFSSFIGYKYLKTKEMIWVPCFTNTSFMKTLALESLILTI